MNNTLRARLAAAAGSGAVAIAVIFGAYYEGTGPTRVEMGVTYYKPYRDTGGVLTVCHGVTGRWIEEGRWYTQDECSALETAAYAQAEAGARRQIRNWDALNEYQQAAIIDFVYNLGEPALATSTLRRRFNDGDIEGGCNELVRWVYGTVGGEKKRLAGLVNRRAGAQELCLHWGK